MWRGANDALVRPCDHWRSIAQTGVVAVEKERATHLVRQRGGKGREADHAINEGAREHSSGDFFAMRCVKCQCVGEQSTSKVNVGALDAVARPLFADRVSQSLVRSLVDQKSRPPRATVSTLLPFESADTSDTGGPCPSRRLAKPQSQPCRQRQPLQSSFARVLCRSVTCPHPRPPTTTTTTTHRQASGRAPQPMYHTFVQCVGICNNDFLFNLLLI